MKVIQESLKPGSAKVADLPLYECLEQDSLYEVVKAWYDHDPGSCRPCGVVCAQTYNYVRTHDSDLSTFCQGVRKCELGRRRCLDSDYVHSRLTVLRKRPVLYICGSLAYDFTIPLRSCDGSVVGVFVDGQLRSRIRSPYSMEMLAREYELEEDTFINCYDELPILDRDRARATTDFLGGEFADVLNRLNERARCRLDIDAFRRDAGVLKQMLEQAAGDGLAKQSWPFTADSDELSDHFAAVSTLSTGSDGEAHPATFEIGFRRHAKQQLSGYFVIEAGPQSKVFREAYRKLRGSQARVLRRDEKNPVKEEILEPVNRVCYESTRRGYEERKIYWLFAALEDHKLEGVAAIAAKHKGELNQLREALEQKADETVSYLERHSLSCLLTRGLGTPDGGEIGVARRKEYIRSARTKVKRLSDGSDRTVSLEWKPLLEYLRFVLADGETLADLSDKQRLSFDTDVVGVLGSPYFSPISELRAFRCLRTLPPVAAPVTVAGRSRRVREPYRPEVITDSDTRGRLMRQNLAWLERHGKEGK